MLYRPTFFHRTPLEVASEHESQAPTLTAGREQEEEFNGCPDNENTNKEEQNSTKQTNNKSPEDELYKLYIELFIDLNFQLFGTHAWMDLTITTTRRLHGTIWSTSL